MTNLEFAQQFNLAVLELQNLSDEQVLQYIEAKQKQIELMKIQSDAANRTLQERGKKARIQIHESDMRYVIPEETLNQKIKEGKKVSKQELNDFLAELD